MKQVFRPFSTQKFSSDWSCFKYQDRIVWQYWPGEGVGKHVIKHFRSPGGLVLVSCGICTYMHHVTPFQQTRRPARSCQRKLRRISCQVIDVGCPLANFPRFQSKLYRTLRGEDDDDDCWNCWKFWQSLAKFSISLCRFWGRIQNFTHTYIGTLKRNLSAELEIITWNI